MTFKIYDGAPKPEKQEIGIAIRPSSWREGFDILLVDPHTGQPIEQAELLCLQPKSDGKLDVYFYKSPNPGFVRRDGRGEMAIGC